MFFLILAFRDFGYNMKHRKQLIIFEHDQFLGFAVYVVSTAMWMKTSISL